MHQEKHCSSARWASATAALAVLILTSRSAHAAPVWNVNIGSEITTSDNFAGAATENTTPNSFWNSVPGQNITTGTPFTLALNDSTNATGTVSLTLTALNASPLEIQSSHVTATELFNTWAKVNGNTSVFNLTIGGLSTSPGVTYDLVVYSAWGWLSGDPFPVTQTVGTGMSGTVTLNSVDTESGLASLTEDTNPANTTAVRGNWLRISGLTPNGSGNLGFDMGGTNQGFSGFQLVQVGTGAPDNTLPTPSPMTWASEPAATSSSSITMTATTASDASGVEYFFDETSGNLGGTDSGWQSSPTYIDTGLSASTTYTYTVKARDKSSARNETLVSSAASATTNPPPSGSVVWNVNIGNQVTTADNYAGAVPQSSPIHWNSITASSYTGLALMDSNGSTTGGITLDLASNRDPGGAGLTSGDKIFTGWFGGAGASSSITLRGLTVAKTYDILFYSDWYWKDGDSLPITQTAGSGLSGTFHLNRILSGTYGTVPALTPDTNPANVTSGAGNIGNYCRIVGIVPDLDGKVSFRIGDAANSAFNGFQLVQTGDVAPRADMLSFELASNPPSIREAAISGTNITLTMPYGSDVSALAPTFTLWPGATCIPVSGTTRDFSTPQTYRVTSSDSQITKNYIATVAIAPPLPEFTLTAPANWDGRQTITVQPDITNLALLQANGGTDFTYQWNVSGLAVTQEITPGVLTLTHSQGSGPLVVTLTITNGTEGVTESTTIQVQEPATDPWVERAPAANEKPVNGQFFARNPFTNLGTIFYNGTQSGTPDTVFLMVYRTPDGGAEALENTSRQALVGGAYAFTAPITAGLNTYRVVYGTTTGGVDTNVATVTDLVCGDAFIIEGQSNAVATAVDYNSPDYASTSKWIRTYNNGKWGYAPKNSGEFTIGYWGKDLADRLVANHDMPICIINGAAGGTRIDMHRPNPANHALPLGSGWSEDIYANLYNRVTGAKLTHGIRGLLWHQGEQDQGNIGPDGDYNYKFYQQYFVDISAAWKQDFPNLGNYYLFQIWPAACGETSRNDQLREVQRTLPYLYSNMKIMSTHGIVPGSGCHYLPEGYKVFADLIGPLVEQDVYGEMPTAKLTAPNLQRAYFTTPAKTEIALVFDQNVAWNPGAPTMLFLANAAGATSGTVSSGSATGNTIKLQVSGASSATAITYLKGLVSWQQANLLYGSNGIAALTFADVPIGTLSPYGIWAGGSFANAFTDTDPSHDPDLDGMTNEEEFAFGLDPTSGASANPITQQLDKATGIFKYTRTKDSGLTYKVYYSTSLSGWTLDAAATQSPAAAVAGIETVTVTLAAAVPRGDKLFVRVEATPTP